MKTDLQWKRGE